MPDPTSATQPVQQAPKAVARSGNDDGYWIVTAKDQSGKVVYRGVSSFPNRGRAAPVIRRALAPEGLTVSDIKAGTRAELQKLVTEQQAKERATKRQPKPIEFQDTRGVPDGTEPDDASGNK